MAQQRKPPLALRLVFLGKHLSRRIEAHLSSRGLNRTQAIVLTALQHHPGLQVQQLSDPAGVEPANVTRTIQSLERLGLLERRPHPTDGRASLFYLTDSGEERARTLSEAVDEVSSEMLRGIGQENLQALERMLDTLMGNLHGGEENHSRRSGCGWGEHEVRPAGGRAVTQRGRSRGSAPHGEKMQP